MLPLSRNFPRSFRDPMYEQLARATEERYGLPSGILDAIRTRGERSNADQVSSAGARTPYQFIPSTRQSFIQKYGVDPWKDPVSATDAAAIHLREDYKRTKSWNEAIARYHGGQRPRTASRKYAARVGSFDDEVSPMPSLFPIPYYGPDPLAPLPEPTALPEPIKDTAPLPGDLGPSAPMPAAAPTAARKRGGLLGALESVFMPDPDSRWAAALRGGIFDAKANQQAYKRGVATEDLKMQEAQAKLKNLLTKGEYQVVGNNVFHIKPDGSTEMITAPQSAGEKERLIDRWRTLDASDPAKDLIERMLLGASADPVLESRERQAQLRAGATTESARIRANSSSKSKELPPLPPGFSVVK